MKLHFEPNLDFQLQAIESVCELFRGQEICQTEFSVTRETLTSLAMLKVHVDLGQDYLDYLRPFIATLVGEDLDPGLGKDGHQGGPGRTWTRTC